MDTAFVQASFAAFSTLTFGSIKTHFYQFTQDVQTGELISTTQSSKGTEDKQKYS